MRKIKISTAIEPVHQILIAFVSTFVAETDQIQGHRRGQLKTVVVPDPRDKLLRQSDVLPDVMLQSLDPVVPDHEPQLERAKAPAQGNLPVAVVNHGPGLCGLVTQIFGQHAQSLDQCLAVRD
jgi:hypothetical protein